MDTDEHRWVDRNEPNGSVSPEVASGGRALGGEPRLYHAPSSPAPPLDGRDAETFAIIGAAMEVHNTLGRGFLEPVYQEALAVEMDDRGLKFIREAALPIHYKGRQLPCSYRADFICGDGIIVELKALDRLSTREQAQLLNYLRATKLRRGLLINFGSSRLEYKRMVV